MRSIGLFVSVAISIALTSGMSSRAEDMPSDLAGSRIFRAANCVACHKWTGQGGGGYGGAAANLRQTKLDKAEVMETVRCGHPGGGGMPYFEKDAYANGTCFGVKAADLDPKTMPAAAEHYLTPREIETVATYVVTHFKGKGDPTYEECRAFFGTDTHLCEGYPHAGDANAAATAPAASSANEHAPKHGLKIEAAPDTNSGKAPQ